MTADSSMKQPAGPALRALGLPRPIQVRLDGLGAPAALQRGRSRELAVASIEEAWRISEAWWRDASTIQRTYYRLLMTDGRPLSVFHDDLAEPASGWYEQQY